MSAAVYVPRRHEFTALRFTIDNVEESLKFARVPGWASDALAGIESFMVGADRHVCRLGDWLVEDDAGAVLVYPDERFRLLFEEADESNKPERPDASVWRPDVAVWQRITDLEASVQRLKIPAAGSRVDGLVRQALRSAIRSHTSLPHEAYLAIEDTFAKILDTLGQREATEPAPAETPVAEPPVRGPSAPRGVDWWKSRCEAFEADNEKRRDAQVKLANENGTLRNRIAELEGECVKLREDYATKTRVTDESFAKKNAEIVELERKNQSFRDEYEISTRRANVIINALRHAHWRQMDALVALEQVDANGNLKP